MNKFKPVSESNFETSGAIESGNIVNEPLGSSFDLESLDKVLEFFDKISTLVDTVLTIIDGLNFASKFVDDLHEHKYLEIVFNALHFFVKVISWVLEFMPSGVQLERATAMLNALSPKSLDVSTRVLYKPVTLENILASVLATGLSGAFGDITTDEISSRIDDQLPAHVADQVKQAYIKRMLEVSTSRYWMEGAQQVSKYGSFFDETGILGAINAYLHPVCPADDPFPSVTILKSSPTLLAFDIKKVWGRCIQDQSVLYNIIKIIRPLLGH